MICGFIYSNLEGYTSHDTDRERWEICECIYVHIDEDNLWHCLMIVIKKNERISDVRSVEAVTYIVFFSVSVSFEIALSISIIRLLLD